MKSHRLPPTVLPATAHAYACVSYPTNVRKMRERTRECIGGDEITAKGVLGSPSQLPYSLLEAEQFEKQLTSKGAKVSIYIGYQPLEEDIKSNLNKPLSPDVLLFSTHGFVWDTLPEYFKGRFPPQNPMYASGLLLAGCDTMLSSGKPDSTFMDGILLAREIGDLNLNNTRLVILSACESGLGAANTIEGVFGLQRAFKLAGAQQVLATLWEIPDSPETVDFIGQFTNRYLENNDARAALRDTQRDFAKKGKNKQVWAAWVII